MLLGIASFALAAIGVSAAVFALIGLDKLSPRYRYPLVAALFLLTFLFSVVGVLSLINADKPVAQVPIPEVTFVIPTATFTPEAAPTAISTLEATSTSTPPSTQTITPVIAVTPSPTSSPGQPIPPANCSELMAGEPHFPSLGADWVLEAISEDRYIHIWSNHWDSNLPEYKFFLPAGQSISFTSGGGIEWIERPGCGGVAKVLFQRDFRKEITVEQYQMYLDHQTIPE